MRTAAATYVQISKEEFIDWLESIRSLYNPPFKVKPGTVGVYLLPLSDNVAVSISSTIGTREDAMGRGDASMQLRLVSLVHGKVLNAKAQGQSRFHRTTNWKETWKKGIQRMKDAYVKAAGFYDAIARIEDRDRYARDLKAKIELIPNWNSTPIFMDFHKKLSGGGVLTVKQEAVILNAVAKVKQVTVSAPATTGFPTLQELVRDRVVGRAVEAELRQSKNFQEDLLAYLRTMWKHYRGVAAFHEKNHISDPENARRSVKYIEDFGKRISKGEVPDRKDWNVLDGLINWMLMGDDA